MEDKFKKKIIGLINAIYFLYLTTGVMKASEILKDFIPANFEQWLVGMFVIIWNAVLWLPMKLAEML